MPTATAAATAVDATPAPVKSGKKKLIIIVAISVLLLLVLGGGAAFFLMKKKSAAEGEGEDAAHAEADKPAKTAKAADKAAPVFVPLDAFTVNLADREAERYAMVGITLEIDDAKLGDQIKAFMPAIRNNILLAIADKTAAQLMERDGKRLLAQEIRRETSRALGYEVGDDEDPERAAKAAKGRKKGRDDGLPVRAVHFNNFIIQ